MAQVITRPAKSPKLSARDGDEVVPMDVTVANALWTGAALNDATLRNAAAHYAALVDSLSVSGPAFSAARVIAVDYHNRAIRRLREHAAEKARRAAEADELQAGLVEIEK